MLPILILVAIIVVVTVCLIRYLLIQRKKGKVSVPEPVFQMVEPVDVSGLNKSGQSELNRQEIDKLIRMHDTEKPNKAETVRDIHASRFKEKLQELERQRLGEQIRDQSPDSHSNRSRNGCVLIDSGRREFDSTYNPINMYRTKSIDEVQPQDITGYLQIDSQFNTVENAEIELKKGRNDPHSLENSLSGMPTKGTMADLSTMNSSLTY